MDIVIGYGGIAGFLVLVVGVLHRVGEPAGESFSDYATAGRSFGPAFSTMAFVNTWLPGTMFVSFAGLAAASGVIGFYFVPYSLLAVLLMFFLARPVHHWGRRFDLRTQADLLGLRYGSRTVRVVAAVIGIVASFPWLVLGLQSLTHVFAYLSFGRVGATTAAFTGIAVLAVRQYWTVRLGARGIVISDLVQGLVAYGLGSVLALGLLSWLVTHGHGFDRVSPGFYDLPGPGSPLGPLYLFSLVLTGALGGWCWPDIFVRLFAADSARTIQRAAVRAAPIIFVFGSALCLVAIAASTLPGVHAAPDAVWFITARIGGPVVLTLAGLCVLAATMGNVGANLQAIGTQTANDIVGVVRGEPSARGGRLAVTLLGVAAAVYAVVTARDSAGLVTLALVSYQGIVQLAPTIYLGLFWRRGNATAATASMVSGFAVAVLLQWHYPNTLPFWGVTSGVAALAVNVAVYVGCAFLVPVTEEEQTRVEALFALLGPDRERVATS